MQGKNVRKHDRRKEGRKTLGETQRETQGEKLRETQGKG